MKVLILAAGYATRLYPRTKNFPKPLLEVNKKPIIDYLIAKIERLKSVSKVIVVTNSRFAGVFEKWRDGLDTPLKIEILDDGTRAPEDRLGAVGDMRLAFEKEKFKGDFLVLGGDNFFRDRLDEFSRRAGRRRSSATIGVFDIKDKKEAKRFGVVSLDRRSGVSDFSEKPDKPGSSLIAMCLYFFPEKTLSFVRTYMSDSNNPSDAAGAYIGWLSARNRVYGHTFKGLWVDIGNKQTYNSINKLIQ